MTPESHIEIERKYDVTDEVPTPRLVGVSLVSAESPPSSVELVAVYYDTAELTLAKQHIALRRREGGADAGWHIKLPGDEGRTELHWPLGTGSEAPLPVLDAIRARTGTSDIPLGPIVPIARVTNLRTTTLLLDSDERVLAELCDDHVHSENLHAGGTLRWREWEVELHDDAPGTREARTDFLNRVEERLLQAGATVSGSSSKLARALGL
jgi:hypothetical protein